MNENDEDLQAYNDFIANINRLKREGISISGELPDLETFKELYREYKFPLDKKQSCTNETKAVPYLDGEKRSYLYHIFKCALKRYGSLSSEEAVIFIWSNMTASTEIPESDYVWFYKKHQEMLSRHGYCNPFEAHSDSAAEQDSRSEAPPPNSRT